MLMFISIVIALVLCHGAICSAADVPFDRDYTVIYGNDHVKFLNQERTEVQMSLDQTSGAGFGSTAKYESGFFRMSLKLPPGDTGGVVTTFYLHSGTNKHDEVDLEFLGNREGKPIILQTNIFANGVGGKEQRMVLWFDPSADYHTYNVLWNPHQIVLSIDDTPIRVFKNNAALGVAFPSQPMQVVASIWDGDDWATDGGKTKIIWAHAPFNAEYKGFHIDGCAANASAAGDCASSNYWWNRRGFWRLNANQERQYREARKSLSYDYCADRSRYPVPPAECTSNS